MNSKRNCVLQRLALLIKIFLFLFFFLLVECDASMLLCLQLNQNGRPVAFLSPSLNKSELNYPSVEKEATAITEAVRKWRHLLLRNHFNLITDQLSVALMFDNSEQRLRNLVGE